MEGPAEERINIANALEDIRVKALLISNAAKENSPHLISSGLPTEIMESLNKFSSLNSRDDAERLLGFGISMWNSVVAIDNPNLVRQYKQQLDNQFLHTVVRLRHVACDCIMIASAVLNFVSAQYNISEKTVAKFYTLCGSKYMAIEQPQVAETCFGKAAEYLQKAKYANAKTDLSDVSFQLLLARSECMWTLKQYSKAHDMVREARKHITDGNGNADAGMGTRTGTGTRSFGSRADDQIQLLANIMYNFAIFEYREGNAANSVEWLRSSIETREMCRPSVMSKDKQSKAALLAGVCLLSLKKFEEARTSIEKAQALSHDPIGKYLLLKIAVVMRTPNIEQLMTDICEDQEASLSLCLTAVTIVAEGEMMGLSVAGYNTLFYRRFESDKHALLVYIGPRLFKSLVAVGQTSEACKVLDSCLNLITNLHPNPELNQKLDAHEQARRWIHVAISEGCNLVEKKDYKWATVVLDKALSFVRDGSLKRNKQSQGLGDILDGSTVSEAAICRVLASSAFSCASHTLSPPRSGIHNLNNGEAISDSYSQTRMMEIAKVNATRAQEIAPDDFSTRLLLFRIFLLQNQADLAAQELRKASANVSSFDAGDFADAACYANDRGSSTAVLAALGCIVEMSFDTLQKSLTSTSQKPREGFYGGVLISMVKLLMKDDDNSMSKARKSNVPIVSVLAKSSADNPESDASTYRCLLSVLQTGVKRITGLGLEIAFGSDLVKRNQSLKFLGDVAWNFGVTTRMKRDAAAFAALSYEFHALRDASKEASMAMQEARVMEACALTEDSCERSLMKAKSCYEDARKLGRTLGVENTGTREKILVGMGRCYAQLKDDDALGCFVEDTCQDSEVSVHELQQLALVCRSDGRDTEMIESESKARKNEMACILLNKAVDKVLQCEEINVDEAAMMLRELIMLEIARGGTERNGMKAFQRAAGLAKERTEAYPKEELRWLAAMAWDQAELLKEAKQEANAKCWIDLAIEMASLSDQLLIYVAQMKAMKAVLETSIVPQG